MLVHHATIWLQNYFVIENIEKIQNFQTFMVLEKQNCFYVGVNFLPAA